MKDFSDYHQAFNYAVAYARLLKREVGIEKTKWYGKTTFVVKSLPKLENRYGHELRMQVVRPDEPFSAKAPIPASV